MNENGPIYNVPLIASLPLGSGSVRQACPSRAGLQRADMNGFTRVVAGYEVVLFHHRKAKAQNIVFFPRHC
jgi:hypothetical protein